MFNDFSFEEPTVSADLLCAIVCDQRTEDLRTVRLVAKEVETGAMSVEFGYSIVRNMERKMLGMIELLYRADVIDNDEFDELSDQIGARYFGTLLKQLKGEN